MHTVFIKQRLALVRVCEYTNTAVWTKAHSVLPPSRDSDCCSAALSPYTKPCRSPLKKPLFFCPCTRKDTRAQFLPFKVDISNHDPCKTKHTHGTKEASTRSHSRAKDSYCIASIKLKITFRHLLQMLTPSNYHLCFLCFLPGKHFRTICFDWLVDLSADYAFAFGLLRAPFAYSLSNVSSSHIKRYVWSNYHNSHHSNGMQISV